MLDEYPPEPDRHKRSVKSSFRNKTQSSNRIHHGTDVTKWYKYPWEALVFNKFQLPCGQASKQFFRQTCKRCFTEVQNPEYLVKQQQ